MASVAQIGGGFYDITFTQANQGSVGVAVSDASAAKYVRKELGLEVMEARNKKALAVLADPAAQLGLYQTEVAKKTTEAGKMFKVDFDELMTYGYPEDKAKAIALEKAGNYLNDEMKILDVQWPYVNDMNLLATATAKAGVNLTGVSQSKQAKYEAAYKARKAKKAAKKAAKKGGQ